MKSKPCRSPYCECDFNKCTHPGFYDARHIQESSVESKLTIEEFFEEHHATEFLKYDKDYELKDKIPDLFVFNILSKFVPAPKSVVNHARHEEIFFEPDPEFVYNSLDEYTMIQLIRYGLRYDGECFCVFV